MKIGICGATGYSGRELVRILLKHPKVEIGFLTSQQFSGQPYSDVFPQFRGQIDLVCHQMEAGPDEAKVDLVFLALPHTLSMKISPLYLKKNVKVIDLSGDYRLLKTEEYEKWYGAKHLDPSGVEKAVYGLCEFFKDKIQTANFIANPGCYPTATCLGLVPALKMGLIDSQNIIIDAKSGVSGAGRSPSLGTHFAEAYEDMKPYKIGTHQHTPEIEQTLKICSEANVNALFVPHLIPIEQGILCTMYGNLKKKIKTAEAIQAYQDFYKGKTFVRVYPEKKIPQTKFVRNSNYCDIGLVVDERTNKLVIISAIDNMIKGASGQAVQNMNLMCGFPENLGL